MSTNSPLVERSTTRKVVGSLAILGTAAAVAGLGTYGNFTDSTTPMNTTVDTGALSINLAQPGGAVAIPVSTAGFMPGDSMSRAVNLINDGGSALGAVTLTSAVTSPANILTTDAVNGLQLAVKACSVAWTQGGSPTAPTYTCSGTERSILSGPASPTAPLGQPRQPRGRRRRQPRVHDLAARHGGQHVPEQERVAQPDLHRRPARRHRPLIAG